MGFFGKLFGNNEQEQEVERLRRTVNRLDIENRITDNENLNEALEMEEKGWSMEAVERQGNWLEGYRDVRRWYDGKGNYRYTDA